MDIPALQSRRLDVSSLSLDQLARSTQIDEKQKIKEVSRAFEAVLLRQILKESQKPAFPSKLIGNSATDGIYKDMVVNQLAENISKSGSFGLAKSLAGELQRQAGAAKRHPHSTAAQASTAAVLTTASVRNRYSAASAKSHAAKPLRSPHDHE
jgi:Rod binding domain-containing protein